MQPTLHLCTLTDERCFLPGNRQQVIHYEQEDGVAQDECHLEGGSVHALWGQHKTEEVHCD